MPPNTAPERQSSTEDRLPVTHLLQRTRWLAAALELRETTAWIELELAGYAEDAEPPEYRKVHTEALQVYNEHKESWLFAGHLHYTLKVRLPLSRIEEFSGADRVTIPVTKNFTVKTDFGDSFGSDWPQRFVIAGSEYRQVVQGVLGRWTAGLEACGLQVADLGKLTAALDRIGSAPEK